MNANDKNKLLDDYINYIETIKGLSENSSKSYHYDLIVFFRFLKFRFHLVPEDISFDEIDISDIDIELLSDVSLPDLYGFLSYAAKERHNSDYSRARKIATLRSFFGYIVGKRKLLSINPVDELERPKLPSRQPVFLTLDESKRLLNAIKGRNKERDYAIITMLLNCGMRLSELTNIKLSDIKEDTLKVVGKGNKERTIYLNHAVLKALDNYLSIREIKENMDLPFLFLSEQNNQISDRAVQHMLKKHLKVAGLDSDKISVHKLRHTAATLMYRYGETDIRSLQKILGHESISTTEIYTHVDEEQLREAVGKNPLSDL
ncbi:MAG: tyrosine recombinase XerC [Eubacterium sp.]